ncbi:virulence factor Mce family protein [Actinomadura craniellae]|uniref:Virulence factor Mce family protein n=1 Tax=Actinomadura craniellae TaxID=2231787 RepID=A0A365HA02_9ACTN|nr:MlaD family protein [Actinomadura craniellae]RAY15842.1 virulence factor Mce family protein [Actinomadura craniellae]
MSDETLSLKSRLIYAAAGLSILAAGAAATVAGVRTTHPGATYYSASFGRAGQGLDERSDVKIRGIAVGGVESVRLDSAGRALVRFRVDEGVRVPSTTIAQIEPVSVFGPKDLVLDLGAGEGRGPYLADGAKVTQTKDPEELSDIAWPAYNLTRAINPDDLTVLMHTFSAGLNGQGPALRRTIDNGAKLIDLTHANRAAIGSLLSDVNLLTGTFEDRGDTFVGLARDLNELSPALAGKPDQFAKLLDGTSRLSATVGDLLDRHGYRIGQIVDGAGRTVSVVYQERRNIPLLIDSLNGFFEGLASVIRIPGPEGSVIAQAVNYLPLDICRIIQDVCGPITTGTGGR